MDGKEITSFPTKGEKAMPYETISFREAEKIIKAKHMEKDVKVTLEYVHDVLYGSFSRRELLRQALDEMDWRENPGELPVLNGRRYRYKGFKNRVAIEGSFGMYEYILEGLLRLQVGFQRQRIDAGILFLNGFRGEKTPYGNTLDLAREEVEMLYPVISMPVMIVLFDLGKPGATYEEEEKTNGVSVRAEPSGHEPGEPQEVLPDHKESIPGKEETVPYSGKPKSRKKRKPPKE
jgi:hypothetical protein